MIYNSFDNPGLVKVLTFLKSHNVEYLSGQDLSDVLKISRVAVWKHIKKIRELRYKIESRQNLGYRLIGNTDLLLPWEITQGLKTKYIGKRAYYFDSIDSTQNQAINLVNDIKENGAIIIAKKQTDGRGRLGRKWISPQGGIWLSIILHPKSNVSTATLFPILTSLALARAIENTTTIKPEVKWPNDITINGKKVAGMIADVSIESSRIESLVLGIGINFDVDSKKIQKIIQKTGNFYGVASIKDHDESSSPIILIQEFLFELEKCCELLNSNKIEIIIKEWSKRTTVFGKTIEISSPDGTLKGKAKRLDNDGALVISVNGKDNRIIVGDVALTMK